MKKIQAILLAALFVFTISCEEGTGDSILPIDPPTTNTGGDGGNGDNGDNGAGGGDEGGGDEGSLSRYSVNGATISLEHEYPVNADLKPFQDAKEKHNEMWNHYVKLVPAAHRGGVYKYIVFHGGGSLLGYVYNVDNQLKDWNMGLDIFSAYQGGSFDSDRDFSYTSIHEFFHIKSLEAGQLDPNVSNCSNYNPGEGCATNNAYINKFFNQYWSDLPAGAENVYNQYPDRFVTEYAGTNPAEDIAESFTAFVFKAKPTGSQMKDEKVRFFYNYPELVSLRNHMRGVLLGSSGRALSQFNFEALVQSRAGKKCSSKGHR